MAQQSNVIEDGYDRIQEALQSVGDEIESFQKRVAKRRKTLERDTRKRVTQLRKELSPAEVRKRAEKMQKDLERDLKKNEYVKRAQKLQKDLEKDIRSNALVKRAQKARKDATKQIETRIDDFLGTFQIATASDVKKLDRKLSQINRKLKELEAARASQPASKASTSVE